MLLATLYTLYSDKEFYPYFDGERSKDEANELVKRNSRRYAKRQLTWFRNKMNVVWFDLVNNPEDIKKIYKLIDDWI